MPCAAAVNDALLTLQTVQRGGGTVFMKGACRQGNDSFNFKLPNADSPDRSRRRFSLNGTPPTTVLEEREQGSGGSVRLDREADCG